MIMQTVRKICAATAAIAALTTAQAAQAENAIYQGECNRAYQLQDRSSIDKLLTFKKYRAVSLHRFGLDREKECDTDTVTHWTLTETSRTKTSVSFDVIILDTIIADKPEPCERVKVWNDELYGTVSFTTKLDKKNEICELYVQADWDMFDAGDPEWSSKFTNRVMMLNSGSMVVAADGPVAGQYNSPIAITGVK
jgi:hypothetical protein